jgi:hypothetical protein
VKHGWTIVEFTYMGTIFGTRMGHTKLDVGIIICERHIYLNHSKLIFSLIIVFISMVLNMNNKSNSKKPMFLANSISKILV